MKRNKIIHVPPYFPDSITWPKDIKIPDCCLACKEHPINNGEGICICSDIDLNSVKCVKVNDTYFIKY